VAEEIYGNLVAAHPGAPDSVHLSDFPQTSPGLVDPGLERAMDAVRAVVSLGRQVRTEAKVRVRQPLATAEIHAPGGPGVMEELVPLVAEELNVKTVRFVHSADELSRSRLRPLFARLGPRLGSRAQEVARVLQADEGTMAAELAAGRSVMVAAGEGPDQFEVTPGDVDFVQQPRPGWGVATDGSITVALELDLDRSPGLRREGMVREVIHHLQALRKSAGLDLTDRIDVVVQANSEDRLAYAVGTATSTIAGEVLARTLTVVGTNEDPADGWDAAQTVDVDGMRARLFVRKT
jgi:isoleucyl-tRNA synthetase